MTLHLRLHDLAPSGRNLFGYYACDAIDVFAGYHSDGVGVVPAGHNDNGEIVMSGRDFSEEVLAAIRWKCKYYRAVPAMLHDVASQLPPANLDSIVAEYREKDTTVVVKPAPPKLYFLTGRDRYLDEKKSHCRFHWLGR